MDDRTETLSRGDTVEVVEEWGPGYHHVAIRGPARRMIVVRERLPGVIELRATRPGPACSCLLTVDNPSIDVPAWMHGPVEVTYRPQPRAPHEIGDRQTWVLRT